MKSGADGFMIKMRDGRHLRCVHNNPQGGHLPDYAPHPAIVLKMEDGTGLLLPIIVCMSFFASNSWQYQNCETFGFHMFVGSFNYFVSLKLLFTFVYSGDAECVAHGSSAQCSNCMFLSVSYILLMNGSGFCSPGLIDSVQY